jgi:hypothetical protein
LAHITESCSPPSSYPSYGYQLGDLLVNLSGERYVAAMPVEMAEFITDCYLYLKNN